MPNDPVEATVRSSMPCARSGPEHRARHRRRSLVHVLRRARSRRRRGAAVERARSGGRRSTPALYVTTAVREFYAGTAARPRCASPGPARSRSRACTWPSSRTPRPGPTWVAVAVDRRRRVLRLRAGPPRPARPGTASTLRHVRPLLLGRRPPHGRDLVSLHDVPERTLGPTDRPLTRSTATTSGCGSGHVQGAPGGAARLSVTPGAPHAAALIAGKPR